MTYPQLYASKGEVVTCENGHEICDMAKDVFVDDCLMVEQFENWRNQKPPMPCEVITPCQTCGAPFVKSEMPFGGTWLHINGEWRRPTA